MGSQAVHNAEHEAPEVIVVHVSPRRWRLALCTGAEQRGDRGRVSVRYEVIGAESYRSEAEAVTAAIAYPRDERREALRDHWGMVKA